MVCGAKRGRFKGGQESAQGEADRAGSCWAPAASGGGGSGGRRRGLVPRTAAAAAWPQLPLTLKVRFWLLW